MDSFNLLYNEIVMVLREIMIKCSDRAGNDVGAINANHIDNIL
jgi:hypothetical protein